MRIGSDVEPCCKRQILHEWKKANPEAFAALAEEIV
jgi:hypothetical protein